MIEGSFSGLDVLGKPFPLYWVRVREVLSGLTEEYIKWEQFAGICKANGIHDEAQMKI